MEGKKYENEQRIIFFFLFSFQFLKSLKFVWGLPKRKFLLGKLFHAGKTSGKGTLPPLKNIPLTPLAIIITIIIMVLAKWCLYRLANASFDFIH